VTDSYATSIIEPNVQNTDDALGQAHGALRLLLAEQYRARAQERQWIARELHDELQQTLAAAILRLSAVERALAPGSEQTTSGVREAKGLVEQAIAATRRILEELRPQVLEGLGVLPTLERVVIDAVTRSGLSCEVELDGRVAQIPIDPAVADCAHRVVQAALENIAEHARASRVELRLELDEREHFVLSISDDGAGFEPDAPTEATSLGLVGIRERLRAIGGSAEVRSRPGQGTAVIIRVPLRADGLLVA